MADELLTTAEAAQMLRVSQKTIARWIRLDQIPAVKLPSGQYRVRRRDVERLLGEGPPAE